MVSFIPVQWLQTIISNCMQMISIENDRKLSAINPKDLKKIYESYSEEEKNKIHQLIRYQFNVKDSVLILSYIIKVIQLDEFQMDAARQICREEHDWVTQIMLEIQVDKIPYELKCKIHRNNIASIFKALQEEYTYIPVCNRNHNRIMIITEQLTENLNHAPTRMTFEIANTLQKKFGFDVEIITCASNEKLPFYIWIGAVFYNSSEYGYVEKIYKDSVLSIYQYPLRDCNIKDYRQMLSKIYEFNPLFVFEMGVCNPIADLPHIFTTTVNLNMVTEAPVSEADIFVRHTRLEESIENLYEKNLNPYQKQIFMNNRFPALFDTDGVEYTRQELNLPEDKFLIAIIGNRLDQEITDSFEQFMKKILQKSEKVDFVIIGETKDLQKRLVNNMFEKRIHYLGYCPNLKGTVGALDLYLNPERLGGGWSSMIALYAGIPVVTLPTGDVAYNVSGEFVVSNYEEMYETICRYMRDSEFYKAQQQEAIQYAKAHGENKVIDFCDEMLKGIKEILLND